MLVTTELNVHYALSTERVKFVWWPQALSFFVPSVRFLPQIFNALKVVKKFVFVRDGIRTHAFCNNGS